MDKTHLKKLIQEVYHHVTEEKCSCGCNTCENVGNAGVILNESVAPKEILSENLRYHVDNQLPLTENTFRYGSKSFLNLWAEARSLYLREVIHVNDDDKEILEETDLGNYGMYEGVKVPLDLPMLEEGEEELNIGDTIEINPKEFPNFEFPYGTEGEIEDINKADYASDDLVYTVKIKYIDSQGDEANTLHIENSSQYLDENSPAYKGPEGYDDGSDSYIDELEEAEGKKKNPPIGKPKRGGSKKFYVYVRDKGKIKKVSFGDTTGLSAKINNPEARRAFAKRHKCGTGEPKTSARYWSCRLPRFSKLLGLKGSFSGFW
jgi:hypothetical protein